MSGTTELRALLDERGIEYYPKSAYKTVWTAANGISYVVAYDDLIEGCIDLHIYPIRPVQAIAATLGERTCHDVSTNPLRFECSDCSGVSLEIAPTFCPCCGAKVVEK